MTGKNKAVFFILVFFIAVKFSTVTAWARDINFDSLYLQDGSFLYKKLSQLKDQTISLAGGEKIARNVSFARWCNGDTIVLVREFSDRFVVQLYRTRDGSVKTLARENGMVSHLEYIANDSRILLYRLRNVKGFPLADTLLIDWSHKQVFIRSFSGHSFFFLSLVPGAPLVKVEKGASFFYDNRKNAWFRLKSSMPDNLLKGKADPALLRMSPDKRNALRLDSERGFYKGKLLWQEGQVNISGICSPREIFFLNESEIIYRNGFSGSYGLAIYSMLTGKKKQLIRRSFNVNLCFSKSAGKVAFLDNQLINIYSIKNCTNESLGIEGEDVYIDPAGNRLITLFRKDLYILRRSKIIQHQHVIANHARKLLSLYRQFFSHPKTWTSDFSKIYLKRKIQSYSRYLKNTNR